MCSSFFQEGPVPDEDYVAVRDLDHNHDCRAYVESLWAWYESLADANFITDAQAHFQERFWEMYLGRALDRAGMHPQSPGSAGPDLFVDAGGQRIHIEATTPGPGDTNDAIPERTTRTVQAVPERQILLRLRSSIHTKLTSWERWIDRQRVSPSDGYIIAINSRRMGTNVPLSDLPFILRSVFPFGQLVAVLDRQSGIITDTYYDYRCELTRSSGDRIRTDIFLTNEYAAVSAVLYSKVNAAIHPDIEGKEFCLVHNPNANVTLPRGFLTVGMEYWLDDDEVHYRNWNQ